MRFEQNRGQTDRRVRFLSRGPGYTLFLTPGETVLSLQPTRAGVGNGSSASRGKSHNQAAFPRAPSALRTRLVGADPHAVIQGAGRLPGTTNYLHGSDPSRWRTGVASYSAVRYRQAYPGIDVLFYGRQRQLEYDFELAAGADPRVVALGFTGAKRLWVDRRGDLLIAVGGGVLRQHRPLAYQRRRGGGRRVVAARWVLSPHHQARLAVGRYDRSQPLTIDPKLSYSTYLGGTGGNGDGETGDVGYGVAVDASGSAYMTGSTLSADFPTSHPLQPNHGANPYNAADVFVSKLSPDGSQLAYSSYLGGGAEDQGQGIAVDGSGNAYLTGSTASKDFPTNHGFRDTCNGCETNTGHPDAFVARLSSDGSKLVYASYLGGTSDENADVAQGTHGAIAVNASGHAFVTGDTDSTDFPTTTNAFQPTAGGAHDAFLSEIDTTMSGAASLVYSSYLGGSGDDRAGQVALDPAGAAYVAGGTSSTDFPTRKALNTQLQGGEDAFAAKFDTRQAGDASLMYSTYVGGTSFDGAYAVAVDGSGRAYLTGYTYSSDFPAGAKVGLASNANSSEDAFVAKLAGDGSSLLYSSYLGGGGTDSASGIAVDNANGAYVAGYSDSTDFPTKAAIQEKQAGKSDAFVTKLDTGASGGGSLAWSTLLGGRQRDFPSGVAVDASGAAYVTGTTLSSDFPTLDALQPNRAGDRTNAFLTKVSASDETAPAITGMSPQSGPATGGTTVVLRGRGLSGVQGVSFGGVPAQSFHVDSSDKITAVAPEGREGDTAYITVRTAQGESPRSPFGKFLYAEGAWKATGSLPAARSSSAAVLLPNGKVLVVGGQGDTSAQLYDPKTGSWRATNQAFSLDDPGVRAVLLRGNVSECGLNCGKVLIVSATTTVLFDPASETFTTTASPAPPRSYGALALLPGGKVLVAGGCVKTFGCDETNTAALYNPVAGAWTPTGPLSTTRERDTATLLPNTNGKVLVQGGLREGTAPCEACPAPPEVFDPAASGGIGGFTEVPDQRSRPRLPRNRTTATVLDGPATVCGSSCGKVLVTGGLVNLEPFISTPWADLFDPQPTQGAGPWQEASQMAGFRYDHVAALLPNGKVLAASGRGDEGSGELYDPSADRWKSAGFLISPREFNSPDAVSGGGIATATLLSSNPDRLEGDRAVCGENCGKVLVVGGAEDGTAELYTPAPFVSGVSPGSGPAAGGTAVTITGTGFTNGPRWVSFGSVRVACPSVSCRVDSYGQVTVTSPAHGEGSVGVSVVTEGGASGPSGAARFRFEPGAEVAGGSGALLSGVGSLAGQLAGRLSGVASAQALAAEHQRARALAQCLARAAGVRDARPRGRRRGTARRRGRRVAARRQCLARFGRTPGRVLGVQARAAGSGRVALSFLASGSDGYRPPAARGYVVRFSTRPIRTQRGFSRARSLCGGTCRFKVSRVGARLTLTVTDLRPGRRYFFAVAARDNVSARMGPRSQTATASTPR